MNIVREGNHLTPMEEDNGLLSQSAPTSGSHFRGPSFHHEAPRVENPSATNSIISGLERKRGLLRVNKNILPSTGHLVTQSKFTGCTGFMPPTQPTSHVSKPDYESITMRLTYHLLKTFVTCNPKFSYQPMNNPRRVLTKPSKPAHNEGHDNEGWDYLLYVNDIIGSQEGQQYQIFDLLGQGTFGQVVKCQNLKTKELVAIKVIKNKPAYYNQSLVEVAILEMLNNQYDKDDQHHLARMKDTFVFRNHLCIIFEMLSVNLYELIKQNQFRGLSTNLVRVFASQILDALVVLNRARIIHCDLKPENILLKSLDSPSIKVIDFGSACHENQTVYTYIQSRFYRSPEVLLGVPYTSSIDMWSLGCIAAELFLGLPIFPGQSEFNQVARIVEMLGIPPTFLCEKGKSTSQFFNRSLAEDNKVMYTLKTMQQYSQENKTNEQASKRYFQGTLLAEVINKYPIMKKGMSPDDLEKETQNRIAFIDFLHGLLNLNPLERWSPQQAKQHPFITGEPFTARFVPARMIKSIAPSKASMTAMLQSGEVREIRGTRPRATTMTGSNPQHVPHHLQRLVSQQTSVNPTGIQTRQSHDPRDYPDPHTTEAGVNSTDMQQMVGNLADIHLRPPAHVEPLSGLPPATRRRLSNSGGELSPHLKIHHKKSPNLSPQSYSQSSMSPLSPISYGSMTRLDARPTQNAPHPYQGVTMRKAHSHMNFDSAQTKYVYGFHPTLPHEESSEAHPRLGETSERPGMPSKLPSATSSVGLWDNMEGRTSTNSRQHSLQDIQDHIGSRRQSITDSTDSGRGSLSGRRGSNPHVYVRPPMPGMRSSESMRPGEDHSPSRFSTTLDGARHSFTSPQNSSISPKSSTSNFDVRKPEDKPKPQ